MPSTSFKRWSTSKRRGPKDGHPPKSRRSKKFGKLNHGNIRRVFGTKKLEGNLIKTNNSEEESKESVFVYSLSPILGALGKS